MNKLLVGLAGVGAGAATMYMADLRQGRRRRARVREAAAHASHVATTAAAMTSRDVQHRLSGVAARLLAYLVEKPAPIEDVLVERVRARLGRLVSHPGAIHVEAANGRITLSGHVFDAELEQVMEGVAAVPGVTAIDNRMRTHAEAGHVSGLQGPGPRKMPNLAAKWFRWTPTERLMATLAGLALVALAAPPRTVRSATGVAGLELITRALTRGRP